MTLPLLPQPDVTLMLDMNGLIKEVTMAAALAEDGAAAWSGRAWEDTVPTTGAEKVRRIVEDARRSGISAFRQITQRFPSGRERAMEYTTVLLGGGAGMLAVGKSLHAVAEMQSQLIAAQQAMERDHWTLRDVEARYRLLFNTTAEAVVVVRAGTFRVSEANPAALDALGLAAGATPEVASLVAAEDRAALLAALRRAREQGQAPAVSVRAGATRRAFAVRASFMKATPETLLLLRWVRADDPASGDVDDTLALGPMIQALPDGFVAFDRDGVVLRANPAFADLVEMGTVDAVVGQRLDRWLNRPGADLAALLSLLRTHGVARLFTTALQGALGGEADVELSAAAIAGADPPAYAVVVRDVGRRLSSPPDVGLFEGFREQMSEPVGRMPLKSLIKATVDGVERHYVKAALEQAGGNRTAASELLGLSRQSLYMKLSRYGLDQDAAPQTAEEDA